MLSFFNKIKNNIRNKLKDRDIISRKRQYEVVIGSNRMVSGDSDDDDNYNRTPDTVTLFHTKIDNKTVKNDYELQELLRTVHIYSINVEQLVLEPRYEDAIRNIPGASDIVKIKMRLLYIIIALNIYKGLFEEKKQYYSVKTTQYIGVFRYNNYILRIDDSPYSFINENEVITALRETPETNIIRPFLIYINKKQNMKNEICECSQAICDCKYYDNVDNHPDMDELPKESRGFYDNLRNNSVSFSVQHYVKDTQTLYNWVKDNIGNTIYKQFSTIQHPFFITLFKRCAQLLCEIHALSVVHGDIKPDNILIREHSDFNINHPEKCKNFTVYLIDFGLSGIDGVGIGTGGTIPYCHPEFKNIRDTNKTSKYFWKTLQLKHDVWSLGIAFITMYIYHDFYNYYHKYPAYFFMSNGYVAPLIFEVISYKNLNMLFTKMLSEDCIPINEVSILLKEIME